MTRNFVDLETGELIEGVVSIRTAKQDQAYKEYKQRETLLNRSDNPFILLTMNMKGLEKMLSTKDLGYYIIMVSYAGYDNRLKASPDAKVPLVRKELQEILKVSSATTMTGLVNRFKKAGLIKEETVERFGKNYKSFVIDPKYAFKKGIAGENSDRETEETVKLFTKAIQRVYAETDLHASSLGFLYKCIPYLHYETNYLVHNPYERDYDKLEFITIDELSEIQNVSRQITSKRLANIVYDDMYCFARVKIGAEPEVRIKANPMVICRKAGMPKELGVEFYVKAKK